MQTIDHAAFWECESSGPASVAGRGWAKFRWRLTEHYCAVDSAFGVRLLDTVAALTIHQRRLQSQVQGDVSSAVSCLYMLAA
jgi:hypothetical protein